ncbi:Extracellular matrix-binding ebh, putative [Babesia ovata]|uniref:Extracellular matrix-binding ebh, putative n=1 Tax=Babesia ovata TaxID=189622 RepID=A0A2H6KIK1_9APIC|nr:Extracellular matrix-binding ebh, putative [Babesia ovata]GBE62818.1 Extracellular matrix-binding ebh, putative [Babesia ovata]
MDLDKWIEKTTKDIEAAQKLVQKILNEVNGIEPAKCKNELDKAIETVETRLQERVADLTEWKEAAHKVLEGTILSSGNVYKDLDPNQQKDSPGETTKIGEGLQQITTAKTAVEGVNTGLIQVKNDLTAWNLAAKDVLSNVVSKATDVHKKLDPEAADTDHKIGTNIKAIEEAKTQLDNANVQLGQQVKALGTWITEAENIRAAAEKKAKEAYDKLKVNETLDENVKKIVKAKDEINRVHNSLNGVGKSLGTWKTEAGKVLAGAITNAQHVHDALDIDDKGKDMPLGSNIDGISSANELIKKANTELATEVQHLGSWKTAAGSVIDKAEQKCEEILKRVDKDHKDNQKGSSGPVIYKQADELQKQGKRLLQAATEAKEKVEQNVRSALQAVVNMDKSLKMDLKGVKDKIKEGIQRVIEDMNVLTLDEKVKGDLGTLKRRIEGLKTEVDKSNGEGLVKNELEALKVKKNELLSGAIKNIQDAESQLGQKFQSAIQTPLIQNVTEVDTAIEALGKAVTGKDNVNIVGIFEHIKGEVAAIKGKAGGNTGLEGIVTKVKGLARAFVNSGGNGFKARVGGWLESILGMGRNNQGKGMKAVTTWIGTYNRNLSAVGRNEGDLKVQVKNNIMPQLNSQIAEAQKQIAKVVDGKVVDNLTAIVSACNTFVDKLDAELTNDKIDHLANKIVPSIKGWMNGQNVRNFADDQALRSAVKYSLVALCGGVKQVATEIKSLGTGRFGEILDKIKPTVDELYNNLTEATKTGKPPDPADGTAQAVDKKLADVNTFVNGKNGDDNITSKFKSNVIHELQQKVDQLPGAVNQFNTEAEAQIKNAARTAIDKAAGKISEDGDITLGPDLMKDFEEAHGKIRSNLKNRLDKQVDDHIGPDDPPTGGQGGDQKVKLEKGNFPHYEKHVTQPVNDTLTGEQGKNEGSLPQAIGNIKTEVFEKLNMIEPSPRNGKAEITTDTFTGPFTDIKTQLDEIKKLVENKDAQPPGKDADGVRDLLEKLKSALDSGKLEGAEKGLEAIRDAIQKLHDNQFTNQPAAIDLAVTQIKLQLKGLREKLKKDKGSDVIETLKDLNTAGIDGKNGTQWTPNGKPLSGLGKIQYELTYQNKVLPAQTKEIEEALKHIKYQLAVIGVKLRNVGNNDDILNPLQRFKRRIGKNAPEPGNLQKIHNEIKNLQEQPFKQHPTEIEQAKDLIKQELTAIQKVLQGTKGSDVIETLNDLKGNGLSGDKVWNVNGQDKKGLKSIESDLKGQQTTLSTQPQNIQTGVSQITGELTKLQTQLNTDVTEKLKKLRDHGLTDGKEAWTIDKHSAKGLTQITTDIETIKSKDVDNVKHYLIALCSAIKHNARDLRDILKEVKDNLIGELTGIKNNLRQLLSGPAHTAIKDLKALLRFLENGKAQIIRDLHAFVEQEVKEAEETLINEARRQYVSNIKEALKAFAQKVEEELRELPWEIDRDLTVEYKGLMTRVEHGLKNDLNVHKKKGSKTLPLLSSAFMSFYLSLEDHVDREINRFHDEEQRKKNPKRQDAQEYSTRLSAVNEALHTVLTYIKDNDTFDHRLQALLRNLTDALSHLRPESFARPSSPLLDGLVEGLTKFAAEFTCAYVSAYAGAQFTDEEGEKCAKVFLTTLPTLCDAFTRLAERCGKGGAAGWRDLSINSSSQLGTFLQRCGYKVSTSPFDQDGELRDDCIGHDVYVLVSQKIEETHDNEHLKKCLSLTHACNLLDLLQCLCTHLTEYYRTCHLKVHPSPRPPCSIYEMLTWCCGLTYNAVNLNVNYDALPSLFEADEQDSADSDVPLMNLSSLALKAHPESITPASLSDALAEVCHRSHSVLTTLLGYGHAGGIYACDFNTNPGGLLYPGDADALLCLLYDVLKRLHHQLYLLYRRCLYNARHGGWLDCWYGRGVGGSSWKCNTMQCPNQECPQKVDQNANQTGNQMTNQNANQACDQHPKCGVKSPLQSFLEDGLVGFLPHQLSPNDTCVSCPACDTTSPGLPCKTPMGLSNITRLASRAGTGRRIMDVLGAFCGGASSPFARLCGYLECLLTRPPRTPDDLFAFFYQFICDWTQSVEHRKAAFEDAVGAACFWQPGVTLDVTPVFRTSDHGSVPDIPHLTGDLFSLVKCNGTPGSAPSHPCGPYLKPLGHDVRATFAKAHAHLYLSWVVYLTETLYDFLCALLQDCERNCAAATSTCHARSCDNQCPAKRRPMAPDSEHLASCPSIVDCDSTTPTLFRLAGSTSGHPAKRTCEDLCQALQVAVKQMNPLHRLAHDTIPEYLYRIRAPFLYTVFTLWSIATLYILHSLLYRMDVLRIRSHLLTNRASHLIDVKALLAGSRRMLSLYKDVDYFDDDFHS